MIQARELRLGNYINNLFGPDFYFRVDEIRPEQGFWLLIQYKDFNYECPFRSDSSLELRSNQASPISLTHRLLTESCGFICQDIGQYSHEKLNRVVLDINTQINENSPDSDDDIVYLSIPKSLHQLQNLYYALTGEELKINF